MSKNLTRKGFAFGALVALGASAFAGTPAFAADSLVLAGNYSTDTTLATAVTGTYTLNASLAPGSVAANIAQLKYKVVAPVGTQADYATDNNNDGTPSATGNTDTAGTALYVSAPTPSATTTNTIAISINSATATSATRSVSVTAFLDANNNNILDAGETSAAQSISFIKHSEITTETTITAPTQGDTSVSALVKFTNINNQSITAGRIGAYFTKGDGSDLGSSFALTSAEVTATTNTRYYATNDFVATDATATVAGTVTAPASTGVKTVAASPTATYIDVTGTGLTVAAAVAQTGATLARATADLRNTVIIAGATGDFRGQTAAAYSATKGGFVFTTGLVTALAKSTAVKVQPLLSATTSVLTDVTATDSTAKASTIGTAATASVVTRALGSFVGNTVKSTTASAASSASASVTQNVALNQEKQVYFLAKDTASTPAAKAGQAVAVAVTVSGATLSSSTGVSVTVNGTTYTSAAALPGATGVAKLALTTGADGKAVITYKTTGFADTNTVTFTAVAENFTAAVTGTDTTRAYSQFIENHEGNVAVTTDGVAAKVDVIVQDQFGGSPADGTFQVNATLVSSSQVTAQTSGVGSDTVAAVVGGKASLSLVDAGTGVGALSFKLARYNVAGNGVLTSPVGIDGTSVSVAPSFGTAGTGATTFTVNVKAAADVAAGEVVISSATKSATTGIYTLDSGTGSGTGSSSAGINYGTHKSVDLRRIVGSAPTILNNDGTTLSTRPYATVAGTVNSASTSTYGGVAVPGSAVTISGAGQMFAANQDGADIYGDGSLTVVADNSGQFSFKVWSHKAGAQTVTVKSGAGTASIKLYFAVAAEADAATATVVVADGASQFQAGRALDVTVTVADVFGNPVALDATWAANTDAKLTIKQTGAGYLTNTGDVVVGSTGVYTTKLITNAGDLGTSTITATIDFYDAVNLTDVVATKSSEFGVTDADVTVGGRAVYASVEFAKGKTVTVSVDGKRLYSKLQSSDAYTELKFTQKTAGKHVVTVRVSGGIVYSETVTTTK